MSFCTFFHKLGGTEIKGPPGLASFYLAMACQPDRSLIPSIKVWLLAGALQDTVASVRTRLPHRLLFKVTEN